MQTPRSDRLAVSVLIISVGLYLSSSSALWAEDEFISVPVLDPSNPDVTDGSGTSSGGFPSTSESEGFFSPLGETSGSDPVAGTTSTSGSGTTTGEPVGTYSGGSIGSSGGEEGGLLSGLLPGLTTGYNSGAGGGEPLGSAGDSFLGGTSTSSQTGTLQALGAGPVIHNPEIPAGVLPFLMTALSGLVFWMRSFFGRK